MISTEAQIIYLPSIGSSAIGYITVAEESQNIPFEIKRVYWTYYTPHDVVRGGHAHKSLQQVIFALNGKIEFKTENKNGEKKVFMLDEPQKGLYFPPLTWREFRLSHNAVLLCLASEKFIEADYIRNYSDFKQATADGK